MKIFPALRRWPILALPLLVWGVLGSPERLAGQLLPASTSALGMAGNYSALARGFAAPGANPANLGFADAPGWSLAIPVAGGLQGLEPVQLGDLAAYDGRLIPSAQKETWLQAIEAEGSQTGSGQVEFTAVAFSVGRFAFQFHTQGFLDADLNPEAAELLLFGNAGRTGSPGDFDLDGSRADGTVVSTVAAGFGIPVARNLFGLPNEVLTLGANVTYSFGNGLLIARDAGSQVQGDPVEVDVSFPVLHTSEDGYDANGGSGFGLDLGIGWQGGDWTLGLAVANVFHTFEWDVADLSYRPGEVEFDSEGNRTDTDERPGIEAPDFLLDQLDALRFDPVITAGAAWAVTPGVRVASDLRIRTGDGLPGGPATRLGVGVDWQAWNFLALQGGASYVTDGVTAGMGAVFTFGPANLGGSFQIRRGDVGDATLFAAGLTFKAR